MRPIDTDVGLRRLSAAVLAATAMLLPVTLSAVVAHAQSWPSKPIRAITTTSPGGLSRRDPCVVKPAVQLRPLRSLLQVLGVALPLIL